MSVYDDATEKLITELPARSPPNRAVVRDHWGLPPRVAIGSLPIDEAQLDFVNGLLSEPLRLSRGQSAFLEELSEHPGEVVEE